MKKNFTLIFSAFILSMSAQAQTAEQLIDQYQMQQKKGNHVEYKFTQTIEDNNTQRVFTQRTFQGIPVYNAYTTYLIQNNAIFSVAESANFNLEFDDTKVTPSLNADQAFNLIAQNEGLTLQHKTNKTGKGIHIPEEFKPELVYYINENRQPILSYALTYRLVNETENDFIHAVIDATDGTILEKHNTTLSCSFDQHSFFNENLASFDKTEWNWLYEDAAVNTASAQYNVYKLPVESPNHGDRSFVNQSNINPTASPNGWHNTAEGSIKTRTEGNNVRAVRDHKSINYNSYESNPTNSTVDERDYVDGGANLDFNFPIDFTKHPFKNWEAATTNLFYMNNIMHDIFYNYGFTEANGNFQRDNFNKGGTGKDNVIALAQTRLNEGYLNNATFATLPDGYSPRMSMFLWNPPADFVAKPLTINSPANIAENIEAAIPTWGGALPEIPLTRNLVLPTKAATTGTPYDGCSTFTNAADVNDKIAVIYRGDCSFVVKAKNAQDAGAKAAIIVNTDDTLLNMAGDDTITIPTIAIKKSNGDAIIKEINQGNTVNASLQQTEIPYFDGSFDNGIIAHEYGHGISTRLTGPLYNSSCLRNKEQMGEGWSDFFGLMVTQLPGDTNTTKRGVGTFATGQATTGVGIRPTVYTTDMTINPSTYAKLKSYGDLNTESPHRTGYLWATMLWDLNWKMIEKYGFSPDLYNGTAGNNMALQLVMTGLKLQPCSPGFVDGRNAILKADEQLYNGANKCEIWATFARRGLGYSANQGSSDSRIDGTAAIDMPPADVLECNLATDEVKTTQFQMYPNPAKDVVYIVDKSISKDLTVDIVDLTGRLVSTQTVKYDGQKGSVSTSNLPKGVYILKFKTENDTITKKLIKN